MNDSTPPASDQVVETNQDARNMAMLAHLLAFLGILGPLIIWLIKKDQYPFVDDQGKESVNFQITVMIAWAICALLFFLVIPLFLLPLITILDIVLAIVGAMKARDGIRYRYPFAIRLIK